MFCMIRNREDYKYYLREDKKANKIKREIPLPFYDDIWKLLRALRRYEYHLNCLKKWPIIKVILVIDRLILYHYSVRTGISISPNCFKEGLTLWHYGGIVVNNHVKAGRYVTLQNGVNIAENVVIGDNVYLAPGVKIAKDVVIPEGCIIGYNAVVTKSLESSNSTYVGIPAKKISNKAYIDRRPNNV